MAQSTYEIKEAPPDDEVPGPEYELERAKLYLQKYSPAAGDSLYDHISEVLTRILEEQPKDAFVSFKEHSRKILDNKFQLGRSSAGRLPDVYVTPCDYQRAVKIMELIKVNMNLELEREGLSTEGEAAETEEDEETSVIPSAMPNLFDDMFYFEQCGVGLPRLRLVRLNLSMRKLIVRTKIENARFWGKIMGREKNYYIVEANLPEWELERRLSSDQGEGEGNTEPSSLIQQSLGEIPGEGEGEGESSSESYHGLNLVFPPMPENTWKEEPDVTPEKIGTGANAKVYFVCNSPGMDDWVELPDVTPQQIMVARKIVHLFTGDLEAEIHSHPAYPGNEKNYLRAQIARISAATHVSPIGFYSFGGGGGGSSEDGEEEEEEEVDEEEEANDENGELSLNRRYQPLSLKDLTDPSLSSWCHHTRAILKQGRVVWQDPSKPAGAEDEDEGEEGEDEEDVETEGESEISTSQTRGRYEREIPPAMLAPLAEDVVQLEPIVPWSVRQSSWIQPDTAVAYVRSNLWPGAYAYAFDKRSANIYVGWGQKHIAYNHNPESMPPVEDQFANDSELVEVQDPTFDDEEAYRIAHLPPSDEGEGEEEESSEEEEDE